MTAKLSPSQPSLFTEEYPTAPSRLANFDAILCNISGGIDGQAAMDIIVRRAEDEDIKHRVFAVFADLKESEWPGTTDIAASQARAYDLPFYVTQNEKETLLQRVERRGKWMSPKCRFCTSDFKRGPIRRIMTRIADTWHEANPSAMRPCKILNVMGMRADESPARAKLLPMAFDEGASSGRKAVTNYLPAHDLTKPQAFAQVAGSRSAGVVHYAYEKAGMPRVSCRHCMYAPFAVHVRAGRQDPAFCKEHVRIENVTGHVFRQDFSMADVLKAVESGEAVGEARDWKM